MELIVTALSSQVDTILGKNGVPFVPFIISLFMFIFVLNEIGLFPFVGKSPTGFTALVVAVALLSGVQLLVLGVIGEYLGRVYEETKGRPQYVIGRIVTSEKTE